MELNTRLNILKEAGQINEEVYKNVLAIIAFIDEKFNIKLTEENGSMLVTHLSVALQRIKNGVNIDEAGEDIVNELIKNKYYTKTLEVINDIEKLINMFIPEKEKVFIIMHLCVLFENENIKIN